MVTGNGLIANAFSEYAAHNEFLVFASGVSNSKSCTDDDFQREQQLLSAAISDHPQKKIVYFSTTSTEDPDLRDTAYVQHKLKMEDLVRKEASHYHIFRLSNLAGASGNPNTVLNFFFTAIAGGHPFQLWKYSERNIIDVADVLQISRHILENNLFVNQQVNIANAENYPVKYIVDCIEAFTHRKAIFTEKEKGGHFNIDISAILPICQATGITFDGDYLPALLEKYYPEK